MITGMADCGCLGKWDGREGELEVAAGVKGLSEHEDFRASEVLE